MNESNIVNSSSVLLQQSIIPIVERWSRGDLDCTTVIPGLNLFRREAPTPPAFCLIKPSVVMVVQGNKQMYSSETVYPYNSKRFLITSLELPAKSETLSATVDKPCLGFNLELNTQLITKMITSGEVLPKYEQAKSSCIGTGEVTEKLLAAFKRLLDLLDEPQAISALLSGVIYEIHYRLLTSDQGHRLCQIASIEGQGFKIAKAIDWLCLNYAEQLKIKDLASSVQMSIPTFHSHFRRLTGMSPLQYQKWLRLNEAKRLMLNEHLDAASAGYQVGYESPSQFSREYSRLFGTSPKRDVEILRAQLVT
ncbi:AraC family transcriptional regulator [Catenovulum sp. 2E275]|uniref:AraC family transcriptional regulator n=1 Tax=Catenovulum sp. 2E275 TaxID=2980497 RepID=UPI0021D21A21|nr:AraC family transcriptional regulator [Catenovulum sp. 2E275]MCU4675917.1 AraC family transcriptional regulator [Catenovulum sp. 2E275]